MRKKKLGVSRFIIFAASLIYLEVLFQFFIYESYTWGMVFGVLFGLPLALLCTVLTGLGPKWLNKTLVTIILVLLEILFAAQLIYYDIFKTFLQVFSITNGAGNALEFIAVIQDSIGKLWWKILLLFVPLIGYFAWPFWGDHGDFSRDGWKVSLILLAGTIVFHGFALLMLLTTGSGIYSPYNLYYNKPVLQMSVKNLGVMTTMRQDAQRMIFGQNAGSLGLSSVSKQESSKEESSIHESSREESSLRQESSLEESSAEESSIEEVFVPEPNILEINFDQLISESPNDTITVMHQYFQAQEPTYTNEYTGMFEGYNLIWITAEAFSSWAIDEELTPTLYKMANSCFVFNNFYTPYFAVSTSDGEYVTHTSLLPKENVWSYYRSSYIEMPFGFGNIFGGMGYTCYGYHNHDYDYYDRDLSHPNMGYIWKGYGNGLYVDYIWPESDLQMMELTVGEYIDQEPFHTYYLTVSGHQLWNFTGGNKMSDKHKDMVQDLAYDDDTIKAYLACQIELDRALEYLMEQLETAGVADHTVIALSADHYPYGLTVDQMSVLEGSDISVDFEIYQNSFILYCPSMEETVQVDKIGSSLDIAPTLANLFKLPYDSRLYMGTDILSDSDPLVIMSDHSFFNDKMLYNATTGEIKFYAEECSDAYVESMIAKVNDKFIMSEAVLDNDYYSYLTDYLSWWNGETYGHLYDPATEDPVPEE